MSTVSRSPSLVSVAEAVELSRAAGLDLTQGQLRRLVRSNLAKYPALVRKTGRVWKIEVAALHELLGVKDRDLLMEERLYSLECLVAHLKREVDALKARKT